MSKRERGSMKSGGKNAPGNGGEKDAGAGGKVAAPAMNFHCRHCIRGRGCADAEKEKLLECEFICRCVFLYFCRFVYL